MLCRPSSRVDRWAKSGGLVGGHPRLCIDTRLPLLRPGGGRELSRRRAVRAPRHGARPRRSLGRARRCSCDGVAGTPQRRHRVARHSRAQLGGQSQPSAPSLVALRAVLDEISEALGHRRPEIAYWRIASVATASLDGSDRGMSKRAVSAITQFDGPVIRAFEGHAFGTDGADRLTSHSRSRGV